MNADVEMPYLVFSVAERHFALPVSCVQTIVLRPHLASLEEAPPWVEGLLDLHGKLIPVIDLPVRFGHNKAVLASIDDHILVISAGEHEVGIVATEVAEVHWLSGVQIQHILPGEAEHSHLVCGEAELDGTIVALLDADLMWLEDDIITPDGSGLMETAAAVKFPRDETKDIAQSRLDRRTQLLRQPQNPDDTRQYRDFTLLRLGEQYYGIGLDSVREFERLHHIAHVPCTPAHIHGLVSLRGEVITLVDLATILHGSETAPGGGRMIIVQLDGRPLAVRVDELVDIVQLPLDAVNPVSAEVAEKQCLLGTAEWRGHWMTLLDLPRLLQQPALVVNEKPG